MYRLYTICNMYLSSVQNGIQSAHVVHELFNKYGLHADDPIKANQLEQLIDWSINHKTMIVTNGGMTEHMEAIIPIVEASGLPWALFDEPGIGDALTCIGVVVPERLYNADVSRLVPTNWFTKMFGQKSEFTPEEVTFIRMLKSKQLAR